MYIDSILLANVVFVTINAFINKALWGGVFRLIISRNTEVMNFISDQQQLGLRHGPENQFMIRLRPIGEVGKPQQPAGVAWQGYHSGTEVFCRKP